MDSQDASQVATPSAPMTHQMPSVDAAAPRQPRQPPQLPQLPPPNPAAFASPAEMNEFVAKQRTMLKAKHEALIDLLIAAPHLRVFELAQRMGLTASYLSTLINSDNFRARLAERRGDLIDPIITNRFEERMEGAESLALEVVMEKLEHKKDADLAMRVLEAGGRGNRFGARGGGDGTPQVVINLPGATASPAEWLNQVKPPPSAGR